MNGGFFSVDLGAFRCATTGGLNQALAHLIMARGTARDNRTTRWSIHAIETYTGISRPKAAKAVGELVARGIWKRTRDGKHPIYEAVPGPEIPDGSFDSTDRHVLNLLRKAKRPPHHLIGTVDKLEAQGFIHKCAHAFSVDEAAVKAITNPLAVWLPNALVDGAADEVTPLELLRQTRSLPAISLLIELYAAQFLPHFGGVPREILKIEFERTKIGEQGPFVVWGFSRKHTVASPSIAKQFLTGQKKKNADGRRFDIGWDTLFWPTVRTIEDLGLVELVGMLLDGDDPEAEIIHPYGVRGGEPEERALAAASLSAAEAMVTAGQLNWGKTQDYWPRLVPVLRRITNATMIEIYRPRYRPHTSATATWYAQMRQITAEYLNRYRAMINFEAGADISASGRPA